MKGPADRMLARLAGGTTPAHVASCYEGLIDVLVIDESDDRPSCPAPVEATAVTKTLMSMRAPRRRLARGGRSLRRYARMRVAILGGTGSFGRALAAGSSRSASDDIVIGSRDEARAARGGRRRARRRAGHRRDERGRGRSADLVVLAVKADAALDTARGVAGPLGSTPLLLASPARSSSTKGRGGPDPDAVSLAERVQAVVAAPVAAGLHSIAAANLDADRRRTRTRWSAATTATPKELAIELAGRLVGGRALDAGPLASARALEGLTAVIVNLNRRYKAHAGMRITGVDGAE